MNFSFKHAYKQDFYFFRRLCKHFGMLKARLYIVILPKII